jgi:excinuclease ABC subunit A
VLAAGPFAPRKKFDFAAAEAVRKTDHELEDVGRHTPMSWQTDGRRWHTVDRVGRNGNPCRWDGRILAAVVDRIERRAELFAETDWSDRAVVEIRAARKSDGWFFHAITGEEWLLKMKFRTARNIFDRDELIQRLALKPLNDMPELPLYGTQPRTRWLPKRGPYQEIELKVHSFKEIDRKEFWDFIDRAVEGFGKLCEKANEKTDILHPWKQLGRTWHFARRGFPLGKTVRWDVKVLEKLMETLSAVAPDGQFIWGNKQVVPVFVPGRKEPWAAVQTKKLDAVYLHLMGPKGRFALGQITGLGHEPDLDGRRADHDAICIKFRTLADLARGDLPGFLHQHLAALR